jgi:hypothetical protein
MAFQEKGSRFALVTEVTEGTPVSPSAVGDYLALQDGFSLAPEFELLENSEIRSTIAQAAPQLGLENPSMSLSHYVKHSGTVATAPEDDLLLKNAFGAQAIRATERDVVSATVSAITVDAGEGVEFAKGDILLVKHASFAWELGMVDSVAGDVLTLAFDLANAPVATTALGRNIKYSGTNSRGSLSGWVYDANGASIQLVAGMKVNEFTMNVESGQLINADYGLNGLEYFWNPLEITATSNDLDFTDDGGAKSITLTTGFFKDPHDAAAALQTALDASSSQNVTVAYSNTTGLFSWTADGTTFDIDWLSTTDTLGAVFGFTADDSGALLGSSDVAYVLTSPQSPSLDSSSPLAAKANVFQLGDQTAENDCISTASMTLSVGNELAGVLDVCSASGRSGQISTSRSVSADIVVELKQFEAEHFKDFRQNNTVKLFYGFGSKSGGNFQEGLSGGLYMSAAKISSFERTVTNDVLTISMTVTGFAEAGGESEVYLNFI